MAKIGFVGLGIMGTPMAQNLIKGGHELYLYSIPGVPKALVSAGGTACASGKEVAGKGDIIIVMVPDTPHVKAALFDENSIAAGLSKGKTVVDMSSISPLETKEFARRSTNSAATTWTRRSPAVKSAPRPRACRSWSVARKRLPTK